MSDLEELPRERLQALFSRLKRGFRGKSSSMA